MENKDKGLTEKERLIVGVTAAKTAEDLGSVVGAHMKLWKPEVGDALMQVLQVTMVLESAMQADTRRTGMAQVLQAFVIGLKSGARKLPVPEVVDGEAVRGAVKNFQENMKRDAEYEALDRILKGLQKLWGPAQDLNVH